MKSIFVLALQLILVSCNTKEPKVTNIWFKATCALKNSSSQTTVCLQYRNEYAFDSSADCDTMEVNYNASARTYLDKQQTCTSANLAGICESDDRRIYYYQTLFTPAEAESECTGIGGSPQPF